MKKFTFLLLVLLTISINASNNRKIVIDKIQDDIRVVEAQGTKIGGFTATKILFTGLQLWESPVDTTFVLVTNVNSNGSLGAMDDAIMLIRTMDGEVIELQSITSENNTKNFNFGNPTVTTTMWRNRITSVYNSNSYSVARNINYWYITPEIIEKLKNGIKKVKIQFENGIYEKEFKKDEMGKIIYDSYLTELQYIKCTKPNDNFKTNF